MTCIAHCFSSVVPEFFAKCWESFVHLIEMWSITDCKDLYDALRKPGNEIEDRRVRMDIAGMKQSLRTNLVIKWTSTFQMPADGLTKAKDDALLYLRRVLKEHRYEITSIVDLKDQLADDKANLKVDRRAVRGQRLDKKKKKTAAPAADAGDAVYTTLAPQVEAYVLESFLAEAIETTADIGKGCLRQG